MNAPIWSMTGAPIAAENDPNTTAPAADRIFTSREAQERIPYILTGGDSATLEIWVRFADNPLWYKFSYGGANVFLCNPDEVLAFGGGGVIPASADLFVRVQTPGPALTRIAFGFC